MSITRRKLLELLPAISAAFIPVLRVEAKPVSSKRLVLGYQLHDDASVFLVERYAHSLALKDEKARWEAQKLFHKGEDLVLGGQNIRGYGARLRWKECVEAYNSGDEPPAFCWR